MTEEPIDATAVEESRPDPTALTVNPQNLPDDVFRAMDALDEVQILDALEGRRSDVMVYSFPMDGGKVTGLSWQGVAEAVRTMNELGGSAIRVAPEFVPSVEEVQETNEEGEVITYFRVMVYALDAKTGGGNWGLATQPKFQTFRDAKKKPKLDSFAANKALSKAQRNAMLPLVPANFREAIIAQALGQAGKVKEIHVAMGDPLIEMPPPLVGDEADSLRGRIRGLHAEVRKLDPKASPPGRFNAKLRRAEIDMESLNELLAEYESLLDHVKGEG